MFRINEDISRAVNNSPDGVIKVEDANGATFWLMSAAAMELRNQIQVGLDELERGEGIPWDKEEFLKASREQKSQGK